MWRRNFIIATTCIAVVAFYLVYRSTLKDSAIDSLNPVIITQSKASVKTASSPSRNENELGDTIVGAHDPSFKSKILPKINVFFSKLDDLKMNPLQGPIQPNSCSKIRVIHTPGGIICRLIISDKWSAAYAENSTFSGVVYFGQRGEDNPIRAISHANTNVLSRLAQGAISMPETEIRKIVERISGEFDLDFSKFEKPQVIEEGLFDYHLGIYTVRYRKKGSDPFNQMNYTFSVSVKAKSETTADLVGYSYLETTLP